MYGGRAGPDRIEPLAVGGKGMIASRVQSLWWQTSQSGVSTLCLSRPNSSAPTSNGS
jgi:hypothetical protein